MNAQIQEICDDCQNKIHPINTGILTNSHYCISCNKLVKDHTPHTCESHVYYCVHCQKPIGKDER